MKRILILMSLLMLIMAAVPLASAQEGLSDEEVALLEQVIDSSSLDLGSLYSSYTMTYFESESQNQSISLSDQESSRSEISTLKGLGRVITGDAPNVAATLQYTYEATEDDVSMSYTIKAEVRLVEDVLYVNAAYVGAPEADVPALPEGWVRVDDPAMYPELDGLALEDFTSNFLDNTDDDPSRDEVIALLRDHATSVTAEDIDIEGITYNAVTVLVGWDGLLAILENQGEGSPDPALLGIFEMALSEQTDLVGVTLYLDADGNTVGRAFAMTMQLTDIDLSQADPSIPPDAAFLSMTMDNEEMAILQDVNLDFEPITAPDTDSNG